MDKTYDIKRIYVGIIAKQTTVDVRTNNTGWQAFFRDEKIFSWDYEDEGKHIGLFVKGISGYKHILTGKIYSMESHITGGKYVLLEDEIYKLSEYNEKLARKVIEKNKSYHISTKDIAKIEQEFNQLIENEYVLNF